jgi:hypothetical protein
MEFKGFLPCSQEPSGPYPDPDLQVLHTLVLFGISVINLIQVWNFIWQTDHLKLVPQTHGGNIVYSIIKCFRATGRVNWLKGEKNQRFKDHLCRCPQGGRDGSWNVGFLAF